MRAQEAAERRERVAGVPGLDPGLRIARAGRVHRERAAGGRAVEERRAAHVRVAAREARERDRRRDRCGRVDLDRRRDRGGVADVVGRREREAVAVAVRDAVGRAAADVRRRAERSRSCLRRASRTAPSSTSLARPGAAVAVRRRRDRDRGSAREVVERRRRPPFTVRPPPPGAVESALTCSCRRPSRGRRRSSSAPCASRCRCRAAEGVREPVAGLRRPVSCSVETCSSRCRTPRRSSRSRSP